MMASWLMTLPPGRAGAGSAPEYKLAILAEYDRLTEPGDKGALLRREGLSASPSWSGVALGMPERCPG